MDWVTLLLTAVGLSMDAFAVSISNSMCFKSLKGGQIVANSASFGLFQGIMPIAGFFAGRLLGGLMQVVDHWVALVLLGFIGGKMVVEGIRSLKSPEDCPVQGAYTGKTMLLQALATSIDALAVGVSFAALSVNIWQAAAAIAIITFVVCLAGGLAGKVVNALLGDWAQIVGGLLLVGIGVKITIEHLLSGT